MISLVVVNYRSAALAIDAIRSARASASSPLHVVVVDNSLDRRESDSLRPHADILLTPDKNLGYGGGINAGRPHCRGDVMIVSNPDVNFGANAIDELARATSDAAVAGPALYWDDAFTWMLPPADTHSIAEHFDEAFASRSSWWASRRDKRRIASRIKFWSLKKTTEISAISGAVMAIRIADFDAIGGFDERFHLYFEETDLLHRMTNAGQRIVYVPSARVRHLYNQSAGADSMNAARAYAESEGLYLEKWYSAAPARLAKAIARARHQPEPRRLDGPIKVATATIVEASPLRSFDTAAGHFATSAEVELPAEVWSSYLAPVLYLRTIDARTGEVTATYARYRT